MIIKLTEEEVREGCVLFIKEKLGIDADQADIEFLGYTEVELHARLDTE